MSFTLHHASERGVAEHGWLHSRFSFSFAEYHNPKRMEFGALRVINDDIVEAGKGFGMHPHQNMEIVSIVTKGALEHRDSEGNHGIIKAGEIQYMSAASGVYHSEHATKDESVALFQIWIHPNQKGGSPLYDQRSFIHHDKTNKWVTLVSGDGREDSIVIKQDASISVAEVEDGATITIPPVTKDHGRLLLIIEGKVEINEQILDSRDELQITDEEEYALIAHTASKVLLFDVPMHSHLS
ncbi:pirin family protein [Sulfuricurvum sp.]|uniref:pirin family protein n=1 Tax=Sulfuricurvum sp. TaxID=2025608 RepID=UPI00260C3E9B|nr:pirin family protein [Sulfuricurvum sp.]MDD2265202.1 pirin family protein [Sulfuricurvum sp.]MDD2784911.1 pirin family protein [Sulfuricurvum sp.]